MILMRVFRDIGLNVNRKITGQVVFNSCIYLFISKVCCL